MVDQIAWSAGFFSFNLAATLVLPTAEFAFLAVSTSVVFMAIVVARAWAVGSRIVVATKVRLTVLDAINVRSMLTTSVVMGIIVVVGIWLIFAESISGVIVIQVILLALGLVLADMPRQGLIFSGKYAEALLVSLTYVGLAVGALFVSAYFHASPMWLWIASSYACVALGWFFHRELGRGHTPLPIESARSHAWRLTAESLYGAVAGQLALLMLYWFTDPAATAGYRLSYSLVFAPAFMLLQGISPLLTVQLAGEISRNGVAKLRTWFLGPGVAIVAAVLCGSAGWMAASFLPVPELFTSVLPFLLPVGLALAGSQVLEFLLIGIRYFLSEHTMHRMRIAIVTVDVLFQAGAIWLGGVDGLILALILLAVLKLIGSMAIGLAISRGRFRQNLDNCE